MSYSLSGSYMSPPIVTSPLYPKRRIHALPKRSLRSRLSEEAAEAIPFPPNPPSTSLPAYNQYGENGEYLNENKVHVKHNGHICDHDHEEDHEHDHYHDHDHEHDGHHHHCHHHHHHHCHHEEDDEDVDSGEDGGPVPTHRPNGYRTVPRSPRSPRAARHARYGGHTAKSSSSGLDGYDALENTNNKKKRKIPTSGSMGMHHATLATDLAHMALTSHKEGLASGHDDGSGVGQYYGSGSAAVPVGMGIQGAGRGRSGRRVSGRNPLGVSVNGSNVRSAARHDQLATSNVDMKDEDVKSDQGIISTAIAIANATALPPKPLPKGQENVGVLDQEPKSPPTNSQFTFTCESDAGKGVSFPEQSLYAAGYAQRASNMPAPVTGPHQKFATHGTQTSPGMPASSNQHQPPAQQPGNAQGPVPGKKTRRRRADVYALAARQRRLQQEYNNLHHPPAPEDFWICEFCEYESIFGVPPHALIRQYEVKDRRERRRLAEKRRLLEKAKLKGRKGKKQTKNAAKASSNTAQQAASQHAYDQQPIDSMPGDDYLDDGYDDDPISMPAPPPQTPLKQPMPGSYDTGSGKSGGVGKVG